MWLQKLISIFFAWWVTPIVMVFFWGRYLRRHDWPGTIYHICLIVAAGLCSLLFYRLTKNTLHHVDNPALSLHPSRWRRTWVYLVLLSSLLLLGSDGVIRGMVIKNSEAEALGITEGIGSVPRFILTHITLMHRTGVFAVTDWLGIHTYANLADADVSTRPSNWSGKEEKDKAVDYVAVKGARLQETNLNYAVLDNAFLVKADFSGALLTGARFAQADLRKANFSRTTLSDATFDHADLKGATFDYADLAYATFDHADLSWVSLSNTNLRRATFIKANIRGADFRGADLRKTGFQEVDFKGADLTTADLRGASLSKSHNLTQAQLDSAYTDATTKISAPLVNPMHSPPGSQ